MWMKHPCKAARLRHPQSQISWYQMLPPRGTSFNTVVALAVIEHASDPAGFLDKLAGCLSADPGQPDYLHHPSVLRGRNHSQSGSFASGYSAGTPMKNMSGFSAAQTWNGWQEECGLVITCLPEIPAGRESTLHNAQLCSFCLAGENPSERFQKKSGIS